MIRTTSHSLLAMALLAASALLPLTAQAAEKASARHHRPHAIRHYGAGPAVAVAPQDENAAYARNAIARCGIFKDDVDRQACVQRVQGTGSTSITGSVMGGGILKENTIQYQR
ncbi:MAG: hypothetical protein LBV61_10295 [Burkholderiaceae bacterium]|jgi:hypothetical protein|nr:hypothetical protein [Burkholderiaceae bacterium]